MNSVISRLINSFADLHVAVLGDVMLDCYLEGQAERICREAPVPVITLERRADAPGGAANTAANLRSLGAEVTLLSAIGDDAEGDTLLRILRRQGITTAHMLACPERITLAKHRLIAAAHMLVRFDQGSTVPLVPLRERVLIRQLYDIFPHCDALVISDYGYGVITPHVIEALAELQARFPRVIVADAKELRSYSHVGLTAVKPNYAEAVRLLGPQLFGGPEPRSDAVAAHGARLLDDLGVQVVAVTLDTDGALVFEHGSPPYRTYARPTAHARAAGAGDTFAGALALALAAGAATPTAAEVASAAAAVVVAHNGTVTCSAQELRACFADHNDHKYVANLEQLAARIEACRHAGQRIVFTNGCFDILHRGHIALLSRARQLGDLLVVGVNTDIGVAHLKGPGRPINSLDDRLEVLAALSCVDYLVAFDDETPERLITALRPHVFAKGGDYVRNQLPEAPLVEALGGQVQILPYMEDHSTTDLIERIRAGREQTLAVGK